MISNFLNLQIEAILERHGNSQTHIFTYPIMLSDYSCKMLKPQWHFRLLLRFKPYRYLIFLLNHLWFYHLHIGLICIEDIHIISLLKENESYYLWDKTEDMKWISHKNRKSFLLLTSGYSIIKGLPYNSENELKTIVDITYTHTNKIKFESFEVIKCKWVNTCLALFSDQRIFLSFVRKSFVRNKATGFKNFSKSKEYDLGENVIWMHVCNKSV